MKSLQNLELIGLALFCLVGGYGCGGDTGTVPPPTKDKVFCDIQAVPCAEPAYQACCVAAGDCNTDTCTPEVGSNSCITDEDCIFPIECRSVFCGGKLVDPDTVIDWTSCPTTVATTIEVGNRVCFRSNEKNAAQACQDECGSLNTLNQVVWPLSGRRDACVGTINTNHLNLNAEGYEPLGCVDPAPAQFSFPSQGTEVVTLKGSGTVTVDGTTSPVVISAGYFNFAAPRTDCNPLDSTCPVQLNQANIELSTFAFNGHTISGLYFDLDIQALTPSGQSQVGNSFLFTIPSGVIFDAIGYVDGNKTGIAVTSNKETLGTLDLDTGHITFQFAISGTLDGMIFEADGVAMSDTVLARAPELTVAPIEMKNLPDSCSVHVELGASATSEAGLPVSINYIVDHRIVGSGESATATLSIGDDHVVSLVATDTNGMEERVFRVVTPTDTLGPVVTLASPLSLWPPNHKYATVTLDDCVESIIDQCDGPLLAQAQITGVTADELDVSPGAGNTNEDAVIVDDRTVKLRAERDGRGNGREYAIEFTAIDSRGNATNATCIVKVGHSI